jgi:hypothetical protein
MLFMYDGNPSSEKLNPRERPNCVASARLNENCAVAIMVGLMTCVASSTACR